MLGHHHGVQEYYSKIARILYKQPELMSHKYIEMGKQENDNKFRSLISDCIDGRDFCHENDVIPRHLYGTLSN